MEWILTAVALGAQLFDGALWREDERLPITALDRANIVALVAAMPEAGAVERVQIGWFPELGSWPGARVQEFPRRVRGSPFAEIRTWLLVQPAWSEPVGRPKAPRRLAESGWRLMRSRPAITKEFLRDAAPSTIRIEDIPYPSDRLSRSDVLQIAELVLAVTGEPVRRIGVGESIPPGADWIYAELPERWHGPNLRETRSMDLLPRGPGLDRFGGYRNGRWFLEGSQPCSLTQVVFRVHNTGFEVCARGLAAEETVAILTRFLEQPCYFEESMCADRRAQIRDSVPMLRELREVRRLRDGRIELIAGQSCTQWRWTIREEGDRWLFTVDAGSD